MSPMSNAPGGPRTTLRFFRYLIGTAVFLTIALLVCYAYPPASLLGVAAMGRGPGYPAPQVIRCVARRGAYSRIEKQMLASSGLVQRDKAGYQQFRTPHGLFWEPT